MPDLRIHLNVALCTFDTPPPPVLFACAAPPTPFWTWPLTPERLTCPACQREAPPGHMPRIALDVDVLSALQCMPPLIDLVRHTAWWPLGLVWDRLGVPDTQQQWLGLELDLQGWLCDFETSTERYAACLLGSAGCWGSGWNSSIELFQYWRKRNAGMLNPTWVGFTYVQNARNRRTTTVVFGRLRIAHLLPVVAEAAFMYGSFHNCGMRTNKPSGLFASQKVQKRTRPSGTG